MKQNTWIIYEKEKKKLKRMNLSAEEYEKRIKELADKIGI